MIQIELSLSDKLKPINADPAQVQQILMNLALNARDAVQDAGRISITTENVHLDDESGAGHVGCSPGEYILLALSDNGCGMKKEIADRIFEPFFTTKEVGKGTGLGLSIVYGIVKSHGGGITCYSEPGHGAVFKIYLPVADHVRSSDGPEPLQAPVGGTETILLVDDEKPIRISCEKFLKKYGYTVLTASDGREGLDTFIRERERIDLVILDLIMPQMGGRECLNEIIKLDPSTKVLIASGYAANGQLDAVLEEGARASIRKPYDMRRLLHTVRTLLNQGSD
jgi:CheY-like chemotaxis protein